MWAGPSRPRARFPKTATLLASETSLTKLTHEAVSQQTETIIMMVMVILPIVNFSDIDLERAYSEREADP